MTGDAPAAPPPFAALEMLAEGTSCSPDGTCGPGDSGHETSAPPSPDGQGARS